MSYLSARVLEKASDRVMDVQGDDPDEDDEVEVNGAAPPKGGAQESAKDR